MGTSQKPIRIMGKMSRASGLILTACGNVEITHLMYQYAFFLYLMWEHNYSEETLYKIIEDRLNLCEEAESRLVCEGDDNQSFLPVFKLVFYIKHAAKVLGFPIKIGLSSYMDSGPVSRKAVFCKILNYIDEQNESHSYKTWNSSFVKMFFHNGVDIP